MQTNNVIVQIMQPAKTSLSSNCQASLDEFNTRANTAESKCSSSNNSKKMGPLDRLLQGQFWNF